MFSTILSNIKAFLIGSVVGVIISIVTYHIVQKNLSASAAKITTNQISGEKISHDNWNFSGDSISFDTNAEGKGSAETVIPKLMIPEASAYLSRTNILSADVMILNISKSPKFIFSPAYLHRWNDFSFGGGLVFSKSVFSDQIIGIKMSAQFQF
jgi:hypothetical protein